jgi:hypothetical protein
MGTKVVIFCILSRPPELVYDPSHLNHIVLSNHPGLHRFCTFLSSLAGIPYKIAVPVFSVDFRILLKANGFPVYMEKCARPGSGAFLKKTVQSRPTSPEANSCLATGP